MGSSKVVFRGPSTLGPGVIRGVLTKGSENRKTGDMAQLFIVPDKVAPHVAQRTGEDTAVCGGCAQRPINGGGCYVVCFQGPLSLWKASGAAPVSGAGETCASLTKPLRLGAYGDPVALPFETCAPLARQAPGWTGYTHSWRDADPRWRGYLMASCDSPEEREEAKRAGWRTFRARPVGAPLLPGEIECPSERVQCAQCLLCMGTARKARDISIEVHGFRSRAASAKVRG